MRSAVTPAGSTVAGRQTVGPQLVTQEFGTRQGATPIITGVVYNGDQTPPYNPEEDGATISGIKTCTSPGGTKRRCATRFSTI